MADKEKEKKEGKEAKKKGKNPFLEIRPEWPNPKARDNVTETLRRYVGALRESRNFSSKEKQRFDLLLRFGLTPQKEYLLTRVAFENVNRNVIVQRYRQRILEVYDRLTKFILNDDPTFLKFRRALGSRPMAESRQLNEAIRRRKGQKYVSDDDAKKIRNQESRGTEGLQKLKAMHQTASTPQHKVAIAGAITRTTQSANKAPDQPKGYPGLQISPEKQRAAVRKLVKNAAARKSWGDHKSRQFNQKLQASTFTARKPPAPPGSDEYNKFHGITPKKKPEKKKGLVRRIIDRFTTEEAEIREFSQAGLEKYISKARRDKKRSHKKGIGQAINKLDAAQGELGAAKIPASKPKQKHWFWGEEAGGASAYISAMGKGRAHKNKLLQQRRQLAARAKQKQSQAEVAQRKSQSALSAIKKKAPDT